MASALNGGSSQLGYHRVPCWVHSSFLVYINDLLDDLSSDAKLFADDTSLFTIVYDENIAAEQLNNDLKIISEWADQWKMQFNPYKTKQAVEVIFSQKRIKPIHPLLYFTLIRIKQLLKKNKNISA